MSCCIHRLSESTINQIAAGEVIENPSSVIKELMENSLDANARHITVEIKASGRQLIRVSDDGQGMAPDDVLLCFERHATSKISQVSHLDHLKTMGFRGEALSSIASISKFKVTSSQDSKEATEVLIEGGSLIYCRSSTRPRGTCVEVRSLFFNVPVRKKFQKSLVADLRDIQKIFSQIAMAHQTMRFTLINNEKVILDLEPSLHEDSSSALQGRIEAILGKEYARGLLPIYLKKDSLTVQGLIGKPSFTRHNRSGQYLFINKRYVFSPCISQALTEAYGTRLSENRFPVCVLHLDLEPKDIDVNVHPQKKEVRLRDPGFVRHLLFAAVDKSLDQGVLEEDFSGSYNQEEGFSFEGLFNQDTKSDVKARAGKPNRFFSQYSEHPARDSILLKNLKSQHRLQIKQKDGANIQKELFLDAEPGDKKCPWRVIYWMGWHSLVEIEEEKINKQLWIVDHRAAFTRILYQDLMEKDKQSQMLLIPIMWECSSQEALFLEKHLALFQSLGFIMEGFGTNTFKIDGVPRLLENKDIKACLEKVLNHLLSDSTGQEDLEIEIALGLCRLFVLEKKEMDALDVSQFISHLMGSSNIQTCPLGKPIMKQVQPHLFF